MGPGLRDTKHQSVEKQPKQALEHELLGMTDLFSLPLRWPDRLDKLELSVKEGGIFSPPPAEAGTGLLNANIGDGGARHRASNLSAR